MYYLQDVQQLVRENKLEEAKKIVREQDPEFLRLIMKITDSMIVIEKEKKSESRIHVGEDTIISKFNLSRISYNLQDIRGNEYIIMNGKMSIRYYRFEMKPQNDPIVIEIKKIINKDN